MAVIREDRKFGIQPIGVVKASRGGEIVANAAIRAADQIGQMAYKTGARQAEKRGTEEAMAAPKETIIGFDPQTQNPVALNELSKMGTIRADAYERIVLRRFEQSMEEELRNKSSEIAMQNQDEGTYRNLFDTYIGGMSENASGLYKEYIANTGSVIRDRTALVLREQAIKRAQAQAEADRERQQQRSEDLAFATALAGGDPTYEALIQINSESGRDVSEFTGSSLNLSEGEQNIRYNDAYGYATGRLSSMTSRELSELKAWLVSGGQFTTMDSPNLNAVKDRVNGALGFNPAALLELGKDLSSNITALSGMETDADRAATLATNQLKTSNLQLGLSLEGNEPLNLARSDISGALAFLDQYSINDADIATLTSSGDNVGELGTRTTHLGNARGQVATGIMEQMLDAIKPTVAEIEDFRNQLLNGSTSGLINAYRETTSIDDTTASRIADLFNQVEPTVYTSELDDAKAYLETTQDRATAAADAIFSQMDADRLVTSVMDGTKTASEALAEIPEASSIADSTFAAISEASRTSSLVQFLNRESADQPFSTDLADELARAAISLKDFNETNYPNIFARNLQDKVQSTYTGLSEETRRQTVSRMLASMPNADAITIATHSANADQISESISKLTTDFGSMDVGQIISEAANLRGRLNENGALESGERTKLLGELNSQVAEVILSRELAKVDDSTARIVASFIGGDASNERIISVFGEDVGQTIVDAISGLDTDQRNSLKEALVTNVNGNIAARESIREEGRFSRVMRQVNSGSGLITGVQDGDIDKIVNSLLVKHGIVDQFSEPDLASVPSDLFTNYGYWSSQTENPNMQQFAIDVVGLAYRGVVHPQLSDSFKSVIQGQYTQEQAASILGIYTGVSKSMSGQENLAVRNIVQANSGLNAQELGTLDSMSRLLATGVSWDIVSSQTRVQSAEFAREFEATYGVTPEQLAKDAANKGWLTVGVWDENPSLHETWTDYVLGLAATGQSKSTIEQMASRFIKDNFVEDPYITTFGSAQDHLTHIPYVQSFSSPDTAAAATMLVQLEAFENYGRQMSPEATREEQVAIGRQFYTRTSSLVGPRGKDLTMDYGLESYELLNQDFDLRGRTAFTFIVPQGANPSDPVFYLSTMNQAGGVNVLNTNPVRVNDPRYLDAVAVLESVRQSDTTNYSGAAWDAMTEYYLGVK